jgi:hypothetical protein
LVGFGVLGLFWMVRQQSLAAPTGYLYDLPDARIEAAYCLAVMERIKEITGGRAARPLERHLDEQIAFWRGRAGDAFGQGRAALGKASNAPGMNEQAHLHLAVQDCAHRAVAFYGRRFSPMSR